MKSIALLVVVLGGCEVRGNVGSNLGPPPDLRASEVFAPVRFAANFDVDILFVVDDSPGMKPKQEELRARLPAFLAGLDARARLHLGVVTSDLGAGPSTAVPNCSPGGLGARLQELGRAAPPECRAPVGKPWIETDGSGSNNNLPEGQDLAATLGCMLAAGDLGCGFEQPLEAALRAVANTPPENFGFLRDEALLVIVFVTDEDDCSAPDDTDLFDGARDAEYGPLLSYRCTRFGLLCDEGLPPQGVASLTNCHPAPAPPGKLHPVDRYVRFFTAPQGAKADPSQVMIATLAAPAIPVEAVQVHPVTHVPCDGPLDGESCAIALAHSCQRADVRMWGGDPAVRLQALAGSVGWRFASSICETDYTRPLTALAASIGTAQQPPGCLTLPLADPMNPDCTVVIRVQEFEKQIPSCRATGGTPPCWEITVEGLCTPLPDPRSTFPMQLALRVLEIDPTNIKSAGCVSAVF